MFFILDEMLSIYSALTLALILILTAVCLNPSRASPDERRKKPSENVQVSRISFNTGRKKDALVSKIMNAVSRITACEKVYTITINTRHF